MIYYHDELNDDFAAHPKEQTPLREDYVYQPAAWTWRFRSWFWYRIIARPFAWLYLKLVCHQRFYNRRLLRQVGRSGAFIYGNHTGEAMDAYIPQLLRLRDRCWTVVGPAAMGLGVTSRLAAMLGAIPLGSSPAQIHRMHRTVMDKARGGDLVAIYPEAHIWPFYTGIRPFTAASFHYPAEAGLPVFAMTNCYKKRRLGRLPRVVTYLDGPFWPDTSLPPRERRQDLRDRCYHAMCCRAAAESTYAWVEYRPVPTGDDPAAPADFS